MRGVEVWIKKDTGVMVDAVRLTEDNVDGVADWCGAQKVVEIDPVDSEEMTGLNLMTPDGMKRASLGTYVIKFGNNYFTSNVRPFEERYRPRDRAEDHPESTGDTRRRLGFADPFS